MPTPCGGSRTALTTRRSCPQSPYSPSWSSSVKYSDHRLRPSSRSLSSSSRTCSTKCRNSASASSLIGWSPPPEVLRLVGVVGEQLRLQPEELGFVGKAQALAEQAPDLLLQPDAVGMAVHEGGPAHLLEHGAGLVFADVQQRVDDLGVDPRGEGALLQDFPDLADALLLEDPVQQPAGDQIAVA